MPFSITARSGFRGGFSSIGECRWGAFLICLQLLRRHPKVHMGRLCLPAHQPGRGEWFTGFQSCLLPKSGICQRRIFLAKTMMNSFFVGPAIQKRGKGTALCPSLGTLLHSPVGPTALWIWGLNSKVKDINGYGELSTAELKQKAWPLRWVVSQGPQLQGPDRQQRMNWNTRVTTAFVIGSSTFDNAGFPQPLTSAPVTTHTYKCMQ